MRVLVTGHHGYIGSVVAPQLAEAGHDVVGLDPSEEMLDAFREVLSAEPADVGARVSLVQADGLAAPDLSPVTDIAAFVVTSAFGTARISAGSEKLMLVLSLRSRARTR